MRFKFLSEAQKPTKLPRIGFIASVSPEAAPNIEPFRRGLRELGYIEGKNILIEYRYRGCRIKLLALWLNWCSSRSMSWFQALLQRSLRPNGRRSRFPLSW